VTCAAEDAKASGSSQNFSAAAIITTSQKTRADCGLTGLNTRRKSLTATIGQVRMVDHGVAATVHSLGRAALVKHAIRNPRSLGSLA
jgi:hypothetical protein